MYPAKRLKILPRSFVNYAVTNAAEKENIDYIPVALGRTPPFAYRCQRMCRIGNQTLFLRWTKPASYMKMKMYVFGEIPWKALADGNTAQMKPEKAKNRYMEFFLFQIPNK